jgi:hypothetical protein
MDAIKKPNQSKSSRRLHAKNSYKTAAECIGSVDPGMSLFAITRGQFSMIDAVLHVLGEVGPAALSIWTWAIASYEVESLERLMIDKRLTGARLVIDFSARQRNADIITRWKTIFGTESVVYVVNHAKIATIEAADGRRVLLRGSMNLNFNPRFEQLDVTEGGQDFDLVKELESELPVMPDPEDTSWAKCAEISGVKDAFAPEQLNIFKVGKVWAK